MFSSERITDATNRSSPAQSRLLTCVAVVLPSERIPALNLCPPDSRYIPPGHVVGTLLSKRNIRCSLCPDPCRAIVPCESVSGQTHPLSHETSSLAALWLDGEGLPALDDALDVFLTLPGDTSTREDDVQPVVSGAMRLPVPRTGFPTHAWGLVERVEPGKMHVESKQRSVALWHSYRLSTYCDREPRSGGDDFVRN